MGRIVIIVIIERLSTLVIDIKKTLGKGLIGAVFALGHFKGILAKKLG
jgi:hypothetical protein